MSLNETLKPQDREETLDPANAVGKTFGERFQVRRYLGGGGFSWVYEGWDTRLDCPVAVKLMRSDRTFSSDDFRREAKLARAFKHPNVVDVYDYGIEDGIPWLAMEYCPGRTLEDALGRPGSSSPPLPDETVSKFVDQISRALESAHDENLVHRDLKPQNIMLVREGQPGEHFKLMDFGISTKLDDPTKTIGKPVGDGAGTAEYMSPEQVRAERGTARSDIYSFGVILYRICTGRLPHPFKGDSHADWARHVHAILEAPPPRLSSVTERKIPPPVEQLVLQCLEKDPHKRPVSMGEVRERFFAAGKKAGQPPGVWPRVAIGLLAVLALVLGLLPLIFPPLVWLPDGFQRHPQAEIREADGRNYYTKLLRRVGAEEIVFLQIPPTHGMRTFYIMEQKVWIGVFEQAEFNAGATEKPWRRNSSEEFLSNDRLPAMSITFEEAHRFALWLAEPHLPDADRRLGRLPSTEQWDAAAGFYDWDAEREPEAGPFKKPWQPGEIAVGRNVDGPLPVGAASADVGPYGCRDMAGNGWELTRTGKPRIGPLVTDAPFASRTDYDPFDAVLYTRGQTYKFDKPLDYQDIQSLQQNPKVHDYAARDLQTTFRIVLEPPVVSGK